MIYEYQCVSCETKWDKVCRLKDMGTPSYCPICKKEGQRMLSVLPSYYVKTHPDIKQDIHELIAGEPASNITEY